MITAAGLSKSVLSEVLNLRKFPYSNEPYARFSQITYRLVTTFCLLPSAVKELLLRVQMRHLYLDCAS